MVVQLVTYLLLFSHYIYQSSQTFQFTSTFPFEEHAFVLKSQVALNELEPNSTNIMCLSITDKCINDPNQYELLSLAKFSSFYNIKKRFQNVANPILLGFKITINIKY
jgi:hypothetical protein